MTWHQQQPTMLPPGVIRTPNTTLTATTDPGMLPPGVITTTHNMTSLQPMMLPPGVITTHNMTSLPCWGFLPVWITVSTFACTLNDGELLAWYWVPCGLPVHLRRQHFNVHYRLLTSSFYMCILSIVWCPNLIPGRHPWDPSESLGFLPSRNPLWLDYCLHGDRTSLGLWKITGTFDEHRSHQVSILHQVSACCLGVWNVFWFFT